MVIIKYIGEDWQRAGIEKLIAEADEDFVPKLTARRTIEQYLKYISESNTFIYTQGQDIFGFASYADRETKYDPEGREIFKDEPHLHSLIISEKSRGSGHGTQLVEACMKDAENKGYSTIVIRTWTTNLRAIKLYKKLGFEIFHSIEKDPLREHKDGTLYLRKQLKN